MCLTNVIGIGGGCDAETPTSGLTLNQIGITQEELDSYIGPEDNNGIELARRKIDFTAELLANEVVGHFADKYTATTLIDSQRIGHPEENLQHVTGQDLQGIELEICNNHSFIDLFIETISVQLDSAADVDVEVWDLYQKKLLDTVTITPVPDEIVTVQFNKTYSSERSTMNLAVLYDADGIDSVKTNITGSGCVSCGQGATATLNGFTKARSVSIDPASDKINQNLTGVSFTAGLSMQYSINCNHTNWLCSFKNLLATPLLYKAAAEIMEYAMFIAPNTRINTSVTINKELITERHAFYMGKYEEKLNNVIKRINLPEDRKCYNCKPKSKHAVIMP